MQVQLQGTQHSHTLHVTATPGLGSTNLACYGRYLRVAQLLRLPPGVPGFRVNLALLNSVFSVSCNPHCPFLGPQHSFASRLVSRFFLIASHSFGSYSHSIIVLVPDFFSARHSLPSLAVPDWCRPRKSCIKLFLNVTPTTPHTAPSDPNYHHARRFHFRSERLGLRGRCPELARLQHGLDQL